MTWKREIITTSQDRRLFNVIMCREIFADNTNFTITIVNGVEMVALFHSVDSRKNVDLPHLEFT